MYLDLGIDYIVVFRCENYEEYYLCFFLHICYTSVKTEENSWTLFTVKLGDSVFPWTSKWKQVKEITHSHRINKWLASVQKKAKKDDRPCKRSDKQDNSKTIQRYSLRSMAVQFFKSSWNMKSFAHKWKLGEYKALMVRRYERDEIV